MTYVQFKNTTLKIWNEYYSFLSNYIRNDSSFNKAKKNQVFLFPTDIIFTRSDNHFIAEFFGASKKFNALKYKENKVLTSEEYFYQFSVSDEQKKKVAFLDFPNLKLTNIVFGIKYDGLDINKRYPNVDFSSFTKGIQNFISENVEIPFYFGEKFETMLIHNTAIFNKKNNYHRFKYILNLSMADKKIDIQTYEKSLKVELEKDVKNHSIVRGIIQCESKEIEKRNLFNQFANIYSSNYRETTIGDFLNKNPDIIKKGLNCDSFLYEQELKWIEGNPDSNEKSIRPDLLLKKKDENLYDICDLKLSNKGITRKKHNRRRLYDYPQDGISQLSNYEDYFKFEANKSYALDNFKINTLNPKLYLIVGSYENFNYDEVKEALRSTKENYIMIDYDTLNMKFLFSKEK